MQELERHEMFHTATHASGAEEWSCPKCGRRFLMHWPPEYSKVVLEVGDETASHVGSKGGLHIGTVNVELRNDSSVADGLQPWLKGLTNLDLDDSRDQAA